MRFHIIKCDWCAAEIKTHYVRYHDVALFDFDFCNDECLDAWRSNGRRPKRDIEALVDMEMSDG